ncbi:LIN 24 Like family member [Trichuris trichiura]|uniref:LIN 24 Like family member n=1 Tax=Trichuris trichiura TaxID=36087 RepID=A0A077Z9M5_TRITR|nr:LIN 24 Like family member [Trichuris trichiura]
MQQKSGSKEEQAIYDLEEIVLIWAKQIFQATKTKEQSRLSQDCLQFNINWSHVRFQFGTPIYEGIPRFGGGSLDRLTSGKVQPRLLYKAVFANRTDHKQEYTFKAERISASICSVTTENGFSRGANFAIKLKTPDDILAANAGFRRDILVCNFDEDTVEEELRWGVDSVVMVPPMTETTAELVMTEAQCTANFSMHIRFNGRVIVTVTDAKSNNALVTIIEGNMADIMQNEIAKGCKAFKLDKRTVVGEVRGSCKFRFGLEQKVTLTQKPLNSDKII